MDNWALSDIERRLANVIRFGVVDQLDETGALVRVRSGGVLTDWLRWRTNRAGPDLDWWALEPGEQVILLAPNGELNQAVVIGSINQLAYPAPGNRKTLHRVKYADGTTKDYDRAASIDRATYPDGTVIEYDATVGKYSLQFSGGTSIEVEAASGNVLADITGNVDATVAGSMTADVATSAEITSPTVTINGTVNINGTLNLAGALVAAPGAGGAGSGASLEGNFDIQGTLDVTGGDVTADGVSLKNHTHPGDSGGTTGTPN
jgi:phage baseplate assembly protein gpV